MTTALADSIEVRNPATGELLGSGGLGHARAGRGGDRRRATAGGRTRA